MSGETTSVIAKVRDTVATDTFAASATSLMLARWGAAETLFARLRGVDLDLVIVRL